MDNGDYADTATQLTTLQLIAVLEFSVRMSVTWKHWPGRKDRRIIICKELVKRGVNPHRYLPEDETG